MGPWCPLKLDVLGNNIQKIRGRESCPTLCNPMDCSLPGSSVHGILQVSSLDCVALPFSRGSPWPGVHTWAFRITGRFFTIWDTRAAQPGSEAPNGRPLGSSGHPWGLGGEERAQTTSARMKTRSFKLKGGPGNARGGSWYISEDR